MNHYEILGVGSDATELQIKEAYRREAMKWHPDRHDGAAAKGEADRRFKDLAVAYRILRNPVDRANYDRQLEQKLRQEYEARQKEQARQQRAHNEQAQQRQTRQEPPQPDFADTGPQLEEQTASNDDANQMFYEQMQDLAFELAGRGFPEFNIWKALVALGCPETLAKTVAARAAKQEPPAKSQFSAETDTSSASRQSTTSPEKFEKNEFYKAALGPKNQTYFIGKFQNFDRSGIAGFSWPGVGQFFAGVFWLFYRRMPINAAMYLVLPVLLSALTLITSALLGSEDEVNVLLILILNISLFIAFWLYLPARMNAMYYNSINNKIRNAQLQSNELAGQLAILKKNGGTTSAVLWLVLILIIGAWVAIALPAYQDYTRRARIAEGFRIGSEAAGKVSDYYNSQNKGPADLAAAGYSLAPSNTVKDTSYNSQTGVLTVTFHDDAFREQALLLVPTVVDRQLIWLCSSSGMPPNVLPQACRATQAKADDRLALIEKENQSAKRTKEEYARVLAVIEAKHPPLNPDSPKFDPAALEWVVTRKAFYEKGGDTAINALQFAVADYAGPR